MDLVLECVIPGVDEPMLIITNPPIIPTVGDIMPGPGDVIYRVVQRAFIVEKAPAVSLVTSKSGRGKIVIQCAIVPIKEEA